MAKRRDRRFQGSGAKPDAKETRKMVLRKFPGRSDIHKESFYLKGTVRIMKLCAGQCRYLIALYHLSGINHVVRSVDIANTLSVTRPSVSRMLKCMARLEFIEPDYSASVKLTDKGRETAERLAKDFHDVNAFFTDILRLDENDAYDQSIQFLASFPEHTVERLSAVTRNTLAKRQRKKSDKNYSERKK